MAKKPKPPPEPVTLKIGDRVFLASGGPAMTVIDFGRHTELVFCQWAGKDGSPRCAAFLLSSLRYRNRPDEGWQF